MSASGPSPRTIKRVEQESDGSDEEDQESDGSDEEAQEFDEETHKALEEIDLCQTEIDGLKSPLSGNTGQWTLNEKALEEILEVEQKFNKLRKPFFDKRNEIIEKIPNFWVTVMKNHPQISLLIDEDEEDCLHFLHRLEVEEFEDIKSGYRLKLFFDANPFFENDVLVKEFHLGIVGDPKSTSSEIQWKAVQTIVKQYSFGLAEKVRDLTLFCKGDPTAKTFFSWFNDHRDPSSDDIAEVIKDDLWPNPLQYYLVPDTEGKSGNNQVSTLKKKRRKKKRN